MPLPETPCQTCGYELRGIRPENPAEPWFLRCPECGTRRDVSKIHAPTTDWGWICLAVVAGAIVDAVAVAGIGLQFPLAILLGGATSLAINWTRRAAALRWEARSPHIPPRLQLAFLIDFLMFSLADAALGLAVIGSFILFRS